MRNLKAMQEAVSARLANIHAGSGGMTMSNSCPGDIDRMRALVHERYETINRLRRVKGLRPVTRQIKRVRAQWVQVAGNAGRVKRTLGPQADGLFT